MDLWKDYNFFTAKQKYEESIKRNDLQFKLDLANIQIAKLQKTLKNI